MTFQIKTMVFSPVRLCSHGLTLPATTNSPGAGTPFCQECPRSACDYIGWTALKSGIFRPSNSGSMTLHLPETPAVLKGRSWPHRFSLCTTLSQQQSQQAWWSTSQALVLAVVDTATSAQMYSSRGSMSSAPACDKR